MKRIIIATIALLLVCSNAFAGYVNGYYRKDGTYVRPHYRSNPDGIKSNNYGSPSSSQRKAYQNLPVLPTYKYDQDSDGIANQYDYDDDNDGVLDDYE